MSKWSGTPRGRIDRAFIVDEFGEVSALEYLARTSRADDGRRPHHD